VGWATRVAVARSACVRPPLRVMGLPLLKSTVLIAMMHPPGGQFLPVITAVVEAEDEPDLAVVATAAGAQPTQPGPSYQFTVAGDHPFAKPPGIQNHPELELKNQLP
jgi:hypothetical protein